MAPTPPDALDPVLRFPLTFASAALSCLTAMCGSGESGAATADLQTESYLGEAVDPARLFRWTPRAAGEPIEVLVEVWNAPDQLPAALAALGYDPERCAEAVSEGLAEWSKHAGKSMRFTLAKHSEGVTLGDEEVRIEVRFEAFDGAGLEGFTEVITPMFDVNAVNRVLVSVRIGSGEVSGEMVYALMLHEFGHALGIVAPAPFTGHSERAGDVMYPVVRWDELSRQDQLAIRELYALEPNLRRADEIPGDGAPTGGDGGWWGWGASLWEEWVRMRSGTSRVGGAGQADIGPVRCGCQSPTSQAE